VKERGPLFELSDVAYTYAWGSSPVLTVDDLMLREGECVAFVGPNGSGKTTLLKLLNHLLEGQDDPKLFRGLVRFRGTPYNRMLARRHTVYLHQHPYMLPGTVLQNMEACAGSSLDAQAVSREALKKMLGSVALADKSDSLAKSLSGGEAQRLALVRAIASDREILLLDEPTASADSASAARIRDLLRALRTQRTIFFSTHHRRLAEDLAERIIELRGGTILHDRRNDSVHEPSS